MKRREFIINSAILAGGAALLGGCNKKELIKSENQITLNLVNKNLEMTERLNVNGLIEKSKVLRKRIELLEKKQKLEETGIRNYAAKFKLQLLAVEMEGL